MSESYSSPLVASGVAYALPNHHLIMSFALSFSHYYFAPRLVPTLAALVALALTLHLGTWQKGRATEKRALQADYDARANLTPLELASGVSVPMSASYRQATAIGTYDAAGQFFVDNKSEGTTVGYHVITPLRLATPNDTRYVLVNRGFVPRAASYPMPPAVSVPAGEVKVTGMLVNPSSKFLELGGKGNTNAISGSVWQNLTINRYIEQTQREVVPLVLLANPTDAGLKAQTERPDARVAKHVEYMLTWYSLAITVSLLWLILNFKRKQPKSTQ
jgi:surfeit locus 1 family protein